MKQLSLLLFIAITIASCVKKSSTSTTNTTTTTTTTTTTNTWVKLTAVTTANVKKPNYVIMMFAEPVTSTTALPPILKQVTTDANGLAYFDLNSMITSSISTTYYFEAFIQNGSDYIWKSVTHYNTDLKKGSMSESSIIVN
jgi:PBP1b-binding outer membrane lipoprotein LpoB